MRADAFREAIASPTHDGRFELPTARGLAPGDRVRIEVSLGALADEVNFDAWVDRSSTTPTKIPLRLVPGQSLALSYVLAVLDGRRQATARRYQRLTSSLPVWWIHRGEHMPCRLENISCGGAFVVDVDTMPDLGQRIELVLREDAPLSVRSEVRWRRLAPDPGFGVSFRPDDRGVADRLAEIVRRHSELPAMA